MNKIKKKMDIYSSSLIYACFSAFSFIFWNFTQLLLLLLLFGGEVGGWGGGGGGAQGGKLI